MSYFETENPQFNPELEKIETKDRVHADVYNQRFEKLIKNDVALNKKIEESKNIISDNIRDSLQNVAKETNPLNIENGINSIDAKTTSISNSINDVNINVANINNSINNINNEFSNVARETTPNNIENKVIQLENKIEELRNSIKNNDGNYLNLPNLRYCTTPLNYNTIDNYDTILNIRGSGYLVASFIQKNLTYFIKNSDISTAIKITIDDNVIYWRELTYNNFNYGNHSIGSNYSYSTLGITNAQNVLSGFENGWGVTNIKWVGVLPSLYIKDMNASIGNSGFSNTKKIINLSKPDNVDISEVLFNRGIRFEKNLKIEAYYYNSVGKVSSGTDYTKIYYLYSLDN